MPPSIGIIIPTYNRAQYLLKAIRSVLAQDFESCEVIVVDDGSTDDTREALGPLLRDDRVRYFHQQNQGRSIARNNGIAASQADLLLFLDSDDMLAPGALSSLFKAARCQPAAGLVIGRRAEFIDADDVPLDVLVLEPGGNGTECIYDQLAGKRNLMLGSYLVRRTMLAEELYFDPSLEPCEDYDFCLRASSCCLATLVDAVVARIRRHGGNTPVDSLRRSGLRVAEAHLKRLAGGSNMVRREDIGRVRTNLLLNIANDYYELQDSRSAVLHYWRVIKNEPLRLVDAVVMRRLFLSCLPIRARAALRELRCCGSDSR